MGHITFHLSLLGFGNSHANNNILLQCLATIVTADVLKEHSKKRAVPDNLRVM